MLKPLQDRELYIWAIIFFVITTVLHFRFQFNLGILWYGVGALIGLHLLPMMELALKTEPSPLRTILAQIVIVPLTFFVLTTSVFVLGKGVILFLNLVFVYLQYKEFKTKGSFVNWMRQLQMLPPPAKQQFYLYIIATIFIVESLLFILV